MTLFHKDKRVHQKIQTCKKPREDKKPQKRTKNTKEHNNTEDAPKDPKKARNPKRIDLPKETRDTKEDKNTRTPKVSCLEWMFFVYIKPNMASMAPTCGSLVQRMHRPSSLLPSFSGSQHPRRVLVLRGVGLWSKLRLAGFERGSRLGVFGSIPKKMLSVFWHVFDMFFTHFAFRHDRRCLENLNSSPLS